MLALAFVASALVVGCGGSGGTGSGGSKNLTIGYIEWDEDVAVSNLAKVLLEDNFKYNVNLQLADVGPLFQGVASGNLDAFMDVWLPNTHKTYWDKYKNQVVDLGQWYQGSASLGLAVPNYVKAQNIEDLNKYQSEFDGKIVGIESGSGIMSVTKNDAIPAYNLNYSLVSSSTPAMLAQVKKAIGAKQPIVFTAWKPHWMFTAYPIHYLKDPKGAMGKSEHLSGITRKGLKQDSPQAYALLDKLTLTESQLGELELAINKAGDPEKGVRNWLKDNQDVVQPWIDAANKA